MWPGASKGAGSAEAETDTYLLQCLERTSSFVTRLRNRGHLTEVGDEGIKAVSRFLHSPFRDQVKNLAQYHHLPLHYDPKTRAADIRILNLLSRRGERLQCRIEHVSITTLPFIALSYEWGDSEKPFSIEVIKEDGASLGNVSLTANLYRALCNLRDASDVTIRHFWIDQISINQEDPVERGRQVDLMGKIYTAARQVISYLGPGEAFDGEGFKLLDRIEDQFLHLYESLKLPGVIVSSRDLFLFQKQIPEELIFVDDVPDSAWRSLTRLVSGPWTRRLWMVQETCLNPAKDGVVLMRGTKTLPFTKIAAVMILHSVGLIPHGCLSNYMNQMSVVLFCWDIRGRKRGRWTNVRICLVTLLGVLANSTDCSDPRDRVFGLLGLADDAQDLGIVADYEKSYAVVLHDVSVGIMSQEPPIDLLRPLGHWQPGNIGNALGLPSWVSQWPASHISPMPFSLFNAATRWAGPVCFSADNLRLKVHGLRVGCVQQSPPASGKPFIAALTPSDLNQFTSMLVKAKSHLDKHHPHPSAILINTLRASAEEEPGSEDVCAQSLTVLLKLLILAKAKLHDRTGEQGIDLLPLISIFTQAEQQCVRNVMTESPLTRRAIFLIDGHRICLAPQHTQAGDLVVAFREGQTLYIIRPCGEDYFYVGDAYMHGLMNGELLDKDGWEDLVEEFSLI